MAKPKARLIKITIISIISVLLIISLGGYFIVHSYIKKINIVKDTEQQVIEEVELEVEPEDENLHETNSPEDEILAIEENIRANMEEKSTPIKEDKDVLNILLIGSDSRKAGGNGRSDAMILISINKSKKEIVASSLLRDIYLQIPGKGNNRLNAAYAFGGANLLLDTIEENFKVKVDKYAAVDFYSFMSIVDAVDGVTLEVTKEEIPIINRYVKELNKLTGQDETKDYLTEPGLLHLNGKQALGYARNRYIGSDFERTARQRRVLEQVFLKVKSADLIQINELLNTFLPQVTSNITEAEVFSLILSLPAYSGYELKQLSIPVKNSYSFMRIEGMSVIGIDFEKNIEVMYNEIY